MNSYHRAALVEQVITHLKIEKGNKYIDATVGGGGHSLEILKKGGLVLGIDRDTDAINYLNNYLKDYLTKGLTLIKGNFAQIGEIASLKNYKAVDGILFDLGVSSHQLDTPDRGFSFKYESILDMRMDQNTKLTAVELVNGLSENQLVELFRKFGEEQLSVPIAREIIKKKHHQKISTTWELKQIIENVYQNQHANFKPNKVFQALRIAVNDELNALRKGLSQSLPILKKGGRLVVISYHSLEDRIVKLMAKSESLTNILNIVTKKPIRPQYHEIKLNPRIKSAKMRVFEKL